jgi:hypothetical protein
MIRASLVALRRFVRRPAFWLLVWANRHVISLWGRSIFAEARRPGGTNSTRMQALFKGLWYETVSANGFSTNPSSKLVTILDDGTPGPVASTPKPEEWEPAREIHIDQPVTTPV